MVCPFAVVGTRLQKLVGFHPVAVKERATRVLVVQVEVTSMLY
jgi:hypothetical protein